MSPRRLSAAALTALALVVAGCSADPEPEASPTPATSASATPTPTETADAGPFPDRPEPTVEPWPDHGDFALDATKASVPAYNLGVDERWDDYDYMNRIAFTAQARWVGSWESDQRVRDLAGTMYDTSEDTGRIGLVSYFGMRDYPCDRAVADASLRDAYIARTQALVEEYESGSSNAWIIMEPGLVADLGSCEGDPRGEWLAEGVAIVADAGAVPYLGVTSLREGDAEAIAATAASMDLSRVAGFAVNIGGFLGTSSQADAGRELLDALASSGVDVASARTGRDPGEPGMGLLIDTSRNGVPIEDPEACNPPEAGIGEAPALVGADRVDAHVWIKRVGESDGTCNGGPTRGQFSQAIALLLAKNGSLDPT